LGLTFFGLTPKYREHIFTRIHEIVFYGQGGYDWDTIYNMPIRYRDFIYNQIRTHYEKQAQDAEKQQKSLKSKTSQTAKPNINPTYTAKRAPSK
jgi:hypothetical protein